LSKCKALTTKADLTVGIAEAVDNLDHVPFQDVKYVAVSTTFATNALVEGVGGTVGLLLLRCPGFEEDSISHAPTSVLNGRLSISGEVLEDLDGDDAHRAVTELLERGDVEALAVSGYASVRNPCHELQVKEIIRELCDLPVVCGHELASSLGFIKRADTAVWNARLLPLIGELIESIRLILGRRGIEAPLMIVKGDGSLLAESLAMERPIETILSGPAASIIGGQKLCGLDDASIVDMGGTTTDIARVRGGRPEVNETGAMVGRHRTSVSAAAVLTTGLGGDSRVAVNRTGEFVIGPRRAVPLSWLGSRFPQVTGSLRSMKKKEEQDEEAGPPEFLVLQRESDTPLSPSEQQVVDELRERPQTRQELSISQGKTHWRFLDTERLEVSGQIQVAAVTPTDALHALDRLGMWDSEAAELGIQILALQLGIEPGAMADGIIERVRRRLFLSLLQRSFTQNGNGKLPGCRSCEELLDAMFAADGEDYVTSISLRHPVVALGAPAGAYFPKLQTVLNTEIIIPDHAEVANAVGAAAGNVFVEVECLIQPRRSGGFVLHTPEERLEFNGLQDAIEAGREKVVTILRARAERAGAAEAVPHVDVIHQKTTTSTGESLLLSTRVRARVVSAPTFQPNGESEQG
ncbi:MAG: hydantoinase/oxoprolinase family protein, partial [Planctomycetota bacterium]|nr:hydantoinase/oxoprolinase family protein [Planctomycetota bacterium]